MKACFKTSAASGSKLMTERYLLYRALLHTYIFILRLHTHIFYLSKMPYAMLSIGVKVKVKYISFRTVVAPMIRTFDNDTTYSNYWCGMDENVSVFLVF